MNEIWLDTDDQKREDFEYETSSSDESLPRPAKSSKSNSSTRIDLALSKMLIASSIPFEVVDSKYFIQFVQELKHNPYYKLPRSHDLRDKVLDGLTEKMLKNKI